MGRRRSKVAPYDGANMGGFEFDERSNLGQSPNSQGTLLQVTQRPRTQELHKGFSAARQDEVIKKVQVFNTASTLPEVLSGEKDVMDLPLEKVGHLLHEQRQVQDMISRSTAPIRRQVDVEVHPQDWVTEDQRDPHVNGYYTPNSRRSSDEAPGGTITVSRDAVLYDYGVSPVLTHELGHAYSTATHRRSSRYDTPERQGREEAFADDFSFTHSRDNQGRTAAYKPAYPSRGVAFSQAYDAARTTPTTLDEAWARNVPPSVLGAKAGMDPTKAQADFIQNNPAIPGLEVRNLPGATGTEAEPLPPHYEGVSAYISRVMNRQDAALRSA